MVRSVSAECKKCLSTELKSACSQQKDIFIKELMNLLHIMNEIFSKLVCKTLRYFSYNTNVHSNYFAIKKLIFYFFRSVKPGASLFIYWTLIYEQYCYYWKQPENIPRWELRYTCFWRTPSCTIRGNSQGVLRAYSKTANNSCLAPLVEG